MSMPNNIGTQLFHRPDYPTTNFSGKIIIVTGSNVGLGEEAVRHLVWLKAEKAIVALRSIAKGEADKAESEVKSGRTCITEVWELDLSPYASVKAFAKRAATFDCLDAAVLDAGIAMENFDIQEDNESTVTMEDGSRATFRPRLFKPTKGRKTQEKVWGEIAGKIEEVQPGILAELGLQA